MTDNANIEQHLLPAARHTLDVITMRPDGPGRHGVALLVAGSRAGAEVWQSWGRRLVAAGVGVVGVAQPGFGKSTGPWDFGGPATLAALDALLVWTRRLPWVAPLRIGFGGYSSGATCACLLAARHHCRILVGAAGVYDLAAWWDHANERSSWALEQIDPAVTPAELAARSPVAIAAQIRCPVVLVHGTTDEVVPLAQAEALAAALAAANNPPQLIRELNRGHSSLQAEPFVAALAKELGREHAA